MQFKQWLTNTNDPNRAESKIMHVYSHHAMQAGFQEMNREWQQHLDYLRDKEIGLPKASRTYSVGQLVGMNMVGVYKMMGAKEFFFYRLMLVRHRYEAIVRYLRKYFS